MDDIRGEKYKLAGIGVLQKGSLVDVFARFARVEETLEDITAQPKKRRIPGAKPGTLAAVLQNMEPLPRQATMPSLSVQDIVDAVVGERDLGSRHAEKLDLNDARGVVRDLGPEKLAQVLVKMGEVRKQVLSEGKYTFVPLLAPKTPQPD